jgi:hypothetical protein
VWVGDGDGAMFFFISFLLPLFLEKFIIDLKDAKHK